MKLTDWFLSAIGLEKATNLDVLVDELACLDADGLIEVLRDNALADKLADIAQKAGASVTDWLNAPCERKHVLLEVEDEEDEVGYPECVGAVDGSSNINQ